MKAYPDLSSVGYRWNSFDFPSPEFGIHQRLESCETTYVFHPRFVVATRNIKAGEIVMGAEKPVVIGPHTIKPSPVCLGCFFPIHFIRDRY